MPKKLKVIGQGEAVIDDETYSRICSYKWFIREDGQLATFIMEKEFLMSQVLLFPEILDVYARDH
jgi:hypothetical protein